MHVAILCEFGTLHGGENSILATLENLPEIDATVLAPPTGRLAERLKAARIRHLPFTVHDADGRRLPRAAMLADLSRMLTSLRPDLLHANSLSMGRLTGALGDSLEIPRTAHLRDILGLSRAAIADLKRNDRLFAVSHATKTFHVAQGIDAERTHVVYNGIDVDAFRPEVCRSSLLRELHLISSVQLLGAVGQIGLRKGLRVLIDATVSIASELPDVHVLMVGERFSGKPESLAYERDLRDAVSAAGLDERVHWLGYRDDVPRLLNGLDILVHAALEEPLGRVLLEGAACGMPIIATDVGGTAEILTDGDSALLVPPNDVGALAAAIRRLLGDDLLRQQLGKSARATVVERFEIRARSQDLAHHWRQVCSATSVSVSE